MSELLQTGRILEQIETGLDPVTLLTDLASACGFNEYWSVWILSSAAAYLEGKERDFSATTVYALEMGWTDL